VAEIDFTTALGRLLRDDALRAKFSSDPAAVATELGVSRHDYEAFVALSANQIERQALALLQKRYHDVRKFARVTCNRLGTTAWSTFVVYAQSHWPTGHNRHLRDALAFCERTVNRCGCELNRLQFALGKRRFAFHPVKDLPINARLHPALQILSRSRRGNITERAIFLRF
jgi:hypothetical protein